MRKGGGKHKGSGFERDMCRLLSSWWSSGETEEVFWRADSGGKAKTTKSMHLCGDLFQFNFDYPKLPCSVEAKFHKDFDWEVLFEETVGSSTQNIINWWKQCSEDAKRAKLIPAMIFKKNFRQAFVMLPFNCVPPSVRRNVPFIVWKDNFVCYLHAFTSTCDPVEFRNLIKRHLENV